MQGRLAIKPLLQQSFSLLGLLRHMGEQKDGDGQRSLKNPARRIDAVRGGSVSIRLLSLATPLKGINSRFASSQPAARRPHR
jgi:hypothetical protein